MRIIFLSIAVIFICSYEGYGQTIVLEREPVADTVESSFGQNRKHFLHQYFSLGFIIGESSPQAEVKFGNSLNFQYGLRYKLKWNSILSSGIDIAYNSDKYILEQNDSKAFPDTIEHDRQKLVLFGFEGNIFQRFNFDPHRGDFIGKFLDLGVGFNWVISPVLKTTDELGTGEVRQESLKKLRYAEPYYLDAFARLASNRYIIYFQYRFTNVLKGEYEHLDMPPLTIGLQLALY